MQPILVLALSLITRQTPSSDHVADVIYLKQQGSAFTLDVFKPKVSNHRAIIYMVSGGWVSSHEAINPGIAFPFTSKGFTVFEVTHGSQPRYVLSEIIGQVRHAVRYIRANAATYDIHGNAIGVFGASSGGHLSLEIGGLGDDGDANAKDPVDQVSSRVNAVVAYMPPTDFENWGEMGKLPYGDPQLQVFMPAFGIPAGADDAKRKEIAHLYSPMSLVKAGFPPTLLIHGDADKLVPVQQSKILDAAFEKAKIVHKLIIVPGTGHDGNTVIRTVTQLVDWFDVNLPKN